MGDDGKTLGRSKYRITGLDCASCAIDVETALKSAGQFGEVAVNFATATVALERGHLEDAQRIVDTVEPGVTLAAFDHENVSGTASGTYQNVIRIASIVVSAALMTIGILLHGRLHDTPIAIAEYAVFLSAYLLVGWRVILSAVRNVSRGNLFDENTLMTIATLGAILIHELPEAVGVMLFFYVGEYLQDLAVQRSRRSVASLMDVRPEYAHVMGDKGLETVAPGSVRPGQTIVVRPGEKIPLDGTIVDGSSYVDTSVLTGESTPKSVAKDDEVLAGTINAGGQLIIRATREFEHSSVAKVLELVEHAASRKAQTDKFITKFARIYTPIVVAAAAAVAFLPPLLFPGALFSEWVYRALILLVISCPCALVISIPLGYFGGIGRASRSGVLVKGANFLETLTQVGTVVFDKTGTLTEGVFQVSDVAPLNGFSKEEVVEYAAHAESRSNHPIARSIMNAYPGAIHEGDVADYQEIPGHGTKVTYRDRRLIAGNDRLLHREAVAHDVCDSDSTVVYVAVDGVLAGVIRVADSLKKGAKQTIQAIHKLGVKRTIMLTGDERAVASRIAAECGIDEYYSNMLPEQKVSKVEELIAAKTEKEGKLLFVGDGINDAPVLSRADIGVAMGAMGSDAAVEAADLVIIDDRPRKLVTAFEIATATKRIVWQNILMAMGVKALFVVLGTIGIATMWEAVFADVGVTLLAVLNSMRVLRSGRRPHEQHSS